ncbi:MAG: hypothetical protein QQN63_00690 [Nitrosopumilus sp.]
MTRITLKDLENLIERLNRVTGSPMVSHTKLDVADKAFPRYKSNPGHYCLDRAYGGNKLVRITSEGSGETNISNGGYDTKTILYHEILAILTGIEIGKGLGE